MVFRQMLYKKKQCRTHVVPMHSFSNGFLCFLPIFYVFCPFSMFFTPFLCFLPHSAQKTVKASHLTSTKSKQSQKYVHFHKHIEFQLFLHIFYVFCPFFYVFCPFLMFIAPFCSKNSQNIPFNFSKDNTTLVIYSCSHTFSFMLI